MRYVFIKGLFQMAATKPKDKTAKPKRKGPQRNSYEFMIKKIL